jgi:hypothetical protein
MVCFHIDPFLSRFLYLSPAGGKLFLTSNSNRIFHATTPEEKQRQLCVDTWIAFFNISCLWHGLELE